MFPPGAIVNGTPGCRTAVARLMGSSSLRRRPVCPRQPPLRHCCCRIISNRMLGSGSVYRLWPPYVSEDDTSGRRCAWALRPDCGAPAQRRWRPPPPGCKSFSWRTSISGGDPPSRDTRGKPRRMLTLRQEAASPIAGSLTSGETERALASSTLPPVALPLHLEQNVGVGIGVMTFLDAVGIVPARLRRILRLELARLREGRRGEEGDHRRQDRDISHGTPPSKQSASFRTPAGPGPQRQRSSSQSTQSTS